MLQTGADGSGRMARRATRAPWVRAARLAGIVPLFGLALFGFAPFGFVGHAPGGAGAAEDAVANSVAGHLLVASEKMGDPRFDKTVIYMVEHNAAGAMGLVVNVPMGEIPFSDLFERLGMESGGAPGDIDVYYGGPVKPGRGFFLHSSDYLLEDSVVIDDEVALTAQLDILQAIARGEGPTRSLFAMGYAGWAPGQLETELARDAWFVIPAEPSLVFADDPSESWKRAAARRSIDL